MTTTAVELPFATASPAEIRGAILPEDQPQFDEQFQKALQAVAETLRLDELDRFLEHWRRIAWSVTAHGHDSWRVLLAKAEHTLRTGELPPGTVSADEVRERLRVRQAQA